jgi:Tfp pilus assembly protein PilF
MKWVAGSKETEREWLATLLSDAVAQHQAGRLDEAKDLYLQILAIDVRHAPSLFGLGAIAQQSGNAQVAEKMIRRAIAIDGDNVQYHFALGGALQAQREFAEALSSFRHVLELNPEMLPARFRVGNVLQLEGKLDESIAEYESILAIKPDSSEAEFNIGNVLRLQGKLPEARVQYQKALKLQPDSVDAKWNLSLLNLLEGDYAAGWPLYESRQQRPTPNLRSFPMPQWKGEPLNGMPILLHAEQGLGDTLQFLRFVPMVVAAGGQVLLDVPEQIVRLAAEIPGVEEAIATGEPIPDHAWQCPLMSLPLAFRMTLDSIPSQVPYLTVPADALQSAAERPWPDNGLRVGLVWGATARSFEDSDRSIPLALFESILSTRDIRFFSLQLGSQAAQLEALESPMTDLSSAIADFADTAALVYHLDLVITVDTSVAHVAGAMGKPTWVLLPFSSDWRWLTHRDDSPWYPTVRLFRQARPRDWPSVLERVQLELELLAQNPGVRTRASS